MLGGPSNAVMTAYNLKNIWCSLTLNWDTMPQGVGIIGESEVNSDGYFHIDITALFKNNLKGNLDAVTEVGIGFKANAEQNGKIEIATTDNCIYPVYYTAVYKWTGIH